MYCTLLGFHYLSHINEGNDNAFNHIIYRPVRKNTHLVALSLRSSQRSLTHLKSSQHLFDVVDKIHFRKLNRRHVGDGPADISWDQPEDGARCRREILDARMHVQENCCYLSAVQQIL